MKIRIGENEYEAPFVVWLGQDQQLHAIDSVGSRIIADDIHSALNELASLRERVREIPLAEVIIAENKTLRQEVEAFRADHHKHDEFLRWAQSYLNDHPDLCKWGERLDVAIKDILLQRDEDIASARQRITELERAFKVQSQIVNALSPDATSQERDALKARVEELEKEVAHLESVVDGG